MKKIAIIALVLVLSLSVSGITMADEKTITHKVTAELKAGYLELPENTKYDEGAFFAELSSLELRLLTDVNLTDQVAVHVISQVELFKDESNAAEYKTVASPIQNYGLTYNPGPVKFIFDAKGRDVVIGIKDEELLKLNVARRYAENSVNPDGDPKLYRYFDNVQAKQLTLEVPFSTSRIVSVFSLEPTPQGKVGSFVGGFGELVFNGGKVALGYQAKMTNNNPAANYQQYKNEVLSGYFVVSVDYQLNDRIRAQFDYSIRDEGGAGYQPWFKPVSFLENYNQTPFLVKDHFNSKFNIDSYELQLRVLNIDKYWLDASYGFKHYRVGVNYRNWAFNNENSQARTDDFVGEVYGKIDLDANWQNYLKGFYRTDKSFGLGLVVLLN